MPPRKGNKRAAVKSQPETRQVNEMDTGSNSEALDDEHSKSGNNSSGTKEPPKKKPKNQKEKSKSIQPLVPDDIQNPFTGRVTRQRAKQLAQNSVPESQYLVSRKSLAPKKRTKKQINTPVVSEEEESEPNAVNLEESILEVTPEVSKTKQKKARVGAGAVKGTAPLQKAIPSKKATHVASAAELTKRQIITPVVSEEEESEPNAVNLEESILDVSPEVPKTKQKKTRVGAGAVGGSAPLQKAIPSKKALQVASVAEVTKRQANTPVVSEEEELDPNAVNLEESILEVSPEVPKTKQKKTRVGVVAVAPLPKAIPSKKALPLASAAELTKRQVNAPIVSEDEGSKAGPSTINLDESILETTPEVPKPKQKKTSGAGTSAVGGTATTKLFQKAIASAVVLEDKDKQSEPSRVKPDENNLNSTPEVPRTEPKKTCSVNSAPIAGTSSFKNEIGSIVNVEESQESFYSLESSPETPKTKPKSASVVGTVTVGGTATFQKVIATKAFQPSSATPRLDTVFEHKQSCEFTPRVLDETYVVASPGLAESAAASSSRPFQLPKKTEPEPERETYDITVLGDYDENLTHRADKKQPSWAKDREFIVKQELICCPDYMDRFFKNVSNGIDMVFPKNKKMIMPFPIKQNN